MSKNQKNNTIVGVCLLVTIILIKKIDIILILIILGVYLYIRKIDLNKFIKYAKGKVKWLLFIFEKTKDSSKELASDIVENTFAIGKQINEEILKYINHKKNELKNYINNIINEYINKIIKEIIKENQTFTEEQVINMVTKVVDNTCKDIIKEIKNKLCQNNQELMNNISDMIKHYMQTNKVDDYELINKEISKAIDESMALYNKQIKEFIHVQINSSKVAIDKSIDKQLVSMKSQFENNNIDIERLEKKIKGYTHSIMDDYVEQNTEQLNKLVDSISKDFKQLKEEVNYEEVNEEVQKTLNKFKENYIDSVQKNIDETLKIVKQLKEANITDFHIIKNKEIRKKFEEAFKIAKNEIDIISPWINNYVLYNTGVYKFMQDAINKGIKIKIVYGIGKNGSFEFRKENSEHIAQKLQEKFYKNPGYFKIRKGNTHSKILICDNKFALVGSYNFLSFAGEYGKYTTDTRDETAAVITDSKAITKLRNQEFNF